MFRRLFAWMQKYERHLSALAMVAGFIIDNLFFGRVDLLQTQLVFAAYTIACFVAIPLLHRIEARAARGIPRPRWRAILPIVTQFALGGFWSGFFVFYVRSAAVSVSWPFILLIIAVLIGNELFHRYLDRLVITSVLFFFALLSYAIFLVPVYTGTMGTGTFLASAALAIGAFAIFTMLLRFFGRERFAGEVWRIRAGAAIVLTIVVVSYVTNILPPLPLSAESVGIYHAVWRVPGEYLATEETDESWQVRYLGAPPALHVVAGESLYAYAAVFAPTALATTVIHRWQWYDPSAKQWVTKAAVSYPIAGGRDGGYRGYSALLMTVPGSWRVSIETTDGRVLAVLPFTVAQVSLPPPEETVTLK